MLVETVAGTNHLWLATFYLLDIAVVSQVLHQFFFLLRILPTIRNRQLKLTFESSEAELEVKIKSSEAILLSTIGFDIKKEK